MVGHRFTQGSAYHPMVKPRADSIARPLIAFVLLGVVALTLVAVVGVIVIRRLATDQALAEARQLTVVTSRVVQRRVNDGLLTGDAESLLAVASVVFDAVLHPPVVRVKIWTADGRIVYSDASELVGSRYTLGEDDLAVLESGGVVSALSDLSSPENRFETEFGELIEVYTRIHTPDRTPLLFETYQLASTIADRRGELAATFAPVLIATLLAFALFEVPLGWVFTRRIRTAARERERLMQRAIESSDHERRRIAGDLHDGPVQELVGLSMRLSAAGENVDDPASSATLRESASSVRGSVRTLRSAIVGIYPPNLRQAGLAAALSDLIARLDPQGIEATLEVDPGADFGPETDELLYRAAQEALRNVEAHAGAAHVRLSVRREGDRAVMEVADDGRGIAAEDAERARAEGHMGLSILADIVRDGGGVVTVGPNDGAGTVVRVEAVIA
jgi:two-component system, NarL family, sensor kinase